MNSSHTSPIPELSIKEYRNILNGIRENVDKQTIENPFLSINNSYKKNIGEFCIDVLIGLKEKRKKSRIIKKA
jgi:hypothetical protein